MFTSEGGKILCKFLYLKNHKTPKASHRRKDTGTRTFFKGSPEKKKYKQFPNQVH